MFTCAAQPGLSRVVMNVIDFDGISIRTRNAKQVSAGPNNEAGWMIGKQVMKKPFSTHRIATNIWRFSCLKQSGSVCWNTAGQTAASCLAVGTKACVLHDHLLRMLRAARLTFRYLTCCFARLPAPRHDSGRRESESVGWGFRCGPNVQ